MKLYHATTQRLNNGTIIDVNNFAGDTTSFYQRLNQDQKTVETYLEQARPTQYYSRKKAIFLFDDPVYCLYFANQEYPDQKVFVYEVETDNANGGFPMCLVQQVYKHLNNKNLIDKIVSEYWQPKKEWCVKEYLASSVTIINKYPDEIRAAMHYNIDAAQADQYFPVKCNV